MGSRALGSQNHTLDPHRLLPWPLTTPGSGAGQAPSWARGWGSCSWASHLNASRTTQFLWPNRAQSQDDLGAAPSPQRRQEPSGTPGAHGSQCVSVCVRACACVCLLVGHKHSHCSAGHSLQNTFKAVFFCKLRNTLCSRGPVVPALRWGRLRSGKADWPAQGAAASRQQSQPQPGAPALVEAPLYPQLRAKPHRSHSQE